MSIHQTNRLLNQGFSIIRFGDGEIELLNGNGIYFQEFRDELRYNLTLIINSDIEKLIICLPDIFQSRKHLISQSKIYWNLHIFKNYFFYRRISSQFRIYGNSFFSRPYYIYQDKSKSKEYFDEFKNMIKGRRVFLFEGDHTYFAVGNDLLNSAIQVNRIICPSQNAFDYVEKIYDYETLFTEDSLIILSLGPSAKVIGFRFHKNGFHVLDAGHLSLEYNWYLTKSNTKISNEHYISKFTEKDLSLYKQQIVGKIN